MSNRVFSVLRQIGPKLLLRAAILVGILIGAGLLFKQYRFEDIIAALDLTLHPERRWQGQVAFLALGGLFTALGGPRQAVSFFAAYAFGLWEGLGLALAATGIGCVVSYFAARSFSEAASRLISGRVDVAVKGWAKHAFTVTLILRLLPVGSNLLGNLAAGVARIPFVPFLAGSLLGYIPQTAAFAMMGSGVNIGSGTQLALSVGLFALSVVLGAWVYARYRKALRADS